LGSVAKPPLVANLQDLLIYSLKGISWLNLKVREKGINEETTDRFLLEGLFSTVTNVNFDQEFFLERVKEAVALREKLKSRLQSAGFRPEELNHHPAVSWTLSN